MPAAVVRGQHERDGVKLIKPVFAMRHLIPHQVPHDGDIVAVEVERGARHKIDGTVKDAIERTDIEFYGTWLVTTMVAAA